VRRAIASFVYFVSFVSLDIYKKPPRLFNIERKNGNTEYERNEVNELSVLGGRGALARGRHS